MLNKWCEYVNQAHILVYYCNAWYGTVAPIPEGEREKAEIKSNEARPVGRR